MPKEPVPKLATSRVSIDRNIMYYTKVMEQFDKLVEPFKRRVMQMTVSHTQAWFAIHREGQWFVAPAKWSGYEPMTVSAYAEHREKISGSASVCVLNQHQYYEVAGTHPAWDRVAEYAANTGASIRNGSALFVFEGEELPEGDRKFVDIITNLVDQVDLEPASLKYIVNHIQRIAA